MARTNKIILRPSTADAPHRDRPGAESVSYLSQLTRQRLLTAQEEIDLAHLVKAGDGKARTRLVESNMRLVINIAKSYHNALVPFEDLVQEGAIGLMTAAERFDPDRGYRFSTYATHWIRQAISRAIDNKARAIRVPAHVSETLRKLERLRTAAMREAGEEPTLEFLAKELGMSIRKVTSLLQTAQDPVSLDMLVGDEETTNLAALLDDKSALDPQEEIIRREVEQEIQHILDSLTDRERTVMRRRLGFEDNDSQVLQDIGTELHLSRERVRQIEAQALKKIRRQSPRLREYLLD
jgi:RNA polymerase primary sigma factor